MTFDPATHIATIDGIQYFHGGIVGPGWEIHMSIGHLDFTAGSGGWDTGTVSVTTDFNYVNFGIADDGSIAIGVSSGGPIMFEGGLIRNVDGEYQFFVGAGVELPGNINLGAKLIQLEGVPRTNLEAATSYWIDEDGRFFKTEFLNDRNGVGTFARRTEYDAAGNIIDQNDWPVDKNFAADIAAGLKRPFCFAAGTPILSPNGYLPIESISVGDQIMAYSPERPGELRPRTVTKVFQNVTPEWLKLPIPSDVPLHDMEHAYIYVTPGHEFLNEFGNFERIDAIVSRRGSIVHSDGKTILATAERVILDAENVELFETAEFEQIAHLRSNLALAPATVSGWKTYNFEVEGDHTYVAAGYRVHNDSQATIDMVGILGLAFGSQLGRLVFEDDSLAIQILAGTTIGVLTQNLAEIIADVGLHAFDGGRFDFGAALSDAVYQLEDVHLDFLTASAGTISSFLIGELGEILGLDGFGADLFSVTTGAYTGTILNQAIHNVANGADLLSGIDFGGAMAVLPGALGTFFGSALAREILPATSIQGTIGGSLGSIAGAALATSAFGSLLGTIGNFIVPGIGAFFGTLIGTFLGDLFADDPTDPEIDLSLFVVDSLPEYRGGWLVAGSQYAWINFDDDVAQRWMSALLSLGQEFVDVTGGQTVSNAYVSNFEMNPHFDSYSPFIDPMARALQQGRVVIEDDEPRYFLNGEEVDSAVLMIDGMILSFMEDIDIAGGDILIKRAIENSDAESTVQLSGAIAVAEEYRQYLENRDDINRLIAGQPDSVFAAAWAITLAQAADFNLSEVSPSDFNGGLKGFLESLAYAGLKVNPGDVLIKRNPNNDRVNFDILVPEDFEVSGVLSVFADRVLTVVSGGKTYLRFSYDDSLEAAGYEHSEHESFFGLPGEWLVNPTVGRDIFVAPDNDRYYFFDQNASQISAGDAEVEASDAIFVGKGGQDSGVGGNGSDWLSGGGGNDFLSGGAGDDILLGGGGADRLEGGAGHDILEGGAGADFITGLDPSLDNGGLVYLYDFDTLSYYSSNAAVTINLETGAASGGHAQGDEFYYILNVVGSAHNDTLIGDEYSNVLEGGAGADVLNGGGTSLSSVAVDWASYQGAKEGVVASLLNPGENTGDAEGDTYIDIYGLRGSSFADMLVGDDDTIALYGHGGNDILVLGSNAVEVDGSFGFDIASYRNASTGLVINLKNWGASSASVRDDILLRIEGHEGSQFNDTLRGDSGDNFLFGLDGNDTLRGSNGNDLLNGGNGDDTLIGGRGFNTLFGGAGNDTFVFTSFNRPDEFDVIEDFGDNADDVIQLKGISNLNSFADVLSRMDETNDGVLIDLGNSGSILVRNHTISSLSADDFAFL